MSVTLNNKAMNRLRQGHPWIFRSDLAKIHTDQAGPVDVLSPNGKLLGQALYSPQSLIALRMMTQGSEKINGKLIGQRIQQAHRLREKLFGAEKVYRLVFGEADGLPSLIIDRYQGHFVFQSLSAGMEIFKDTIIQSLQKFENVQSIVERNDVAIRQKEGLEQTRQTCFGETPQEVVVSCCGKKFTINPLEGQKTGFFLDQRFNAQTVAPWLQGEVLDAFCYSGQFAIHASPHADHILCVDQSEPALTQVQENARLNQCENIDTQHDNVFDFLKNQVQAGKTYDAVLLDPPAFVKGRSALNKAIKGYKEINLRALKLLKPGGILVTSSCSQNLSTMEFEKLLQSAARDAHRKLQILRSLTQAPDHPFLLGVPETRYLKGYVAKIL